MAADSKGRLWMAWGALTLALSGFLGFGLFGEVSEATLLEPARLALLPGQTSHGHYQIELKCGACHGEGFAGGEALQEACERCHGAELKEADDKHPRSKFTDPRNAERVAKLDATRCVACHVEHRPRITGEMGVTLQKDFCVLCHKDIAKDRPSHAGMAFDTCASAGCHNFHDNRALYEDFLLKHADEPAQLPKQVLLERDFAEAAAELGDYPSERYPLEPLAAERADAPAPGDPALLRDWLETAHAAAGVNCSACHQPGDKGPGSGAWTDHPDHKACAGCHGPEVKGFLAGRHGMRLEQQLSPMTPQRARHQPMREDAPDEGLGCTSCHGAHRFDTRKAAVEACLGCHDDEHSKAYKGSPHYRLWQAELAGAAPAGSGVSCTTCHMPRARHRSPDDVVRTLVQHNQNDTLRPREKMARPACMLCHGLQFTLDALADPAQVARNYSGASAKRVDGIDMARAAERRAEEDKRRARESGAAESGEGPPAEAPAIPVNPS